MIPLTLVEINIRSKKSKIRTNVRKVLQRDKCLNTYIQPIHKIINVLYLMNFYIEVTSNLIVKLQMIVNFGGILKRDENTRIVLKLVVLRL